ncbi:hypothetical protein OAW28_03440 [Alphaproteobacteria bacterium]|nr:hypothetical protein [Alphaproteobacteria bacterium]
MPEFDLFIGVDWSGAKGLSHRGIAVSEAKKGSDRPIIVSPTNGAKYWSRKEVVSYLLDRSKQQKVLAGIDFAFCYPYLDKNSYFPDAKNAPKTAIQLWSLIEQINQNAPDYYGGIIWQHPIFSAYYNSPGNKGSLFSSRRRETELVARQIKSPSPTFNCVGPAGVGTGSLAGMRMLHDLKGHACRWPIETNFEVALTVCEIFPTYYFALAGIRAIKGVQAQLEILNQALAFFGSEPMTDDFIAKGPDFDEADALISAAALRNLADKRHLWQVPESAMYEGWIFGVE